MAKPKMIPCPLCGWKDPRMAEVTVQSTGKTYYAGRCANDACRLADVPGLRYCHESYEDAARAWNGMRKVDK